MRSGLHTGLKSTKHQKPLESLLLTQDAQVLTDVQSEDTGLFRVMIQEWFSDQECMRLLFQNEDFLFTAAMMRPIAMILQSLPYPLGQKMLSYAMVFIIEMELRRDSSIATKQNISELRECFDPDFWLKSLRMDSREPRMAVPLCQLFAQSRAPDLSYLTHFILIDQDEEKDHCDGDGMDDIEHSELSAKGEVKSTLNLCDSIEFWSDTFETRPNGELFNPLRTAAETDEKRILEGSLTRVLSLKQCVSKRVYDALIADARTRRRRYFSLRKDTDFMDWSDYWRTLEGIPVIMDTFHDDVRFIVRQYLSPPVATNEELLDSVMFEDDSHYTLPLRDSLMIDMKFGGEPFFTESLRRMIDDDQQWGQMMLLNGAEVHGWVFRQSGMLPSIRILRTLYSRIPAEIRQTVLFAAASAAVAYDVHLKDKPSDQRRVDNVGVRVHRLKESVLDSQGGHPEKVAHMTRVWSEVVTYESSQPSKNLVMCAAASVLFNERLLRGILPSEDCFSDPSFWAVFRDLYQYCRDMDDFRPPPFRWTVFTDLLSPDCVSLLQSFAL